MSHFVELLSVLMDLVAHGPRFCSALQFRSWNKLLVGVVGAMVEPEEALEFKGLLLRVGLILKWGRERCIMCGSGGSIAVTFK